MNIDVLAGLSAATDFALESSPQEPMQSPAGEKCLLFDPVKGGNILPTSSFASKPYRFTPRLQLVMIPLRSVVKTASAIGRECRADAS